VHIITSNYKNVIYRVIKLQLDVTGEERDTAILFHSGSDLVPLLLSKQNVALLEFFEDLMVKAEWLGQRGVSVGDFFPEKLRTGGPQVLRADVLQTCKFPHI
jgi:hypothetical protein